MARLARCVLAVLVVAALLATDAGAPDALDREPFSPGAPGLGDPYFPAAGNGGYDVQHYGLRLRYDPDARGLAGTTTVSAVATQALSRFDLDFAPHPVDSVTVDGAAAQWRFAGDELVVTPARGIRRGRAFRVAVTYRADAGDARAQGLIRTTDGVAVAGEPTSAVTWFPANDHPRDKASLSMEITVPDGYAAVAGGRSGGTRPVAGGTVWSWEERRPLAPYLATLAIGHFRVTTGVAAGLPMVNAVADTLSPTDVDPVLARTGEVVSYLSTVFGPYPFEDVGGIVPAAEELSFALETQTRPIYSPAFFTGPDERRIRVVVHELAHQWFGDSVSVRDWRDIWLNEGFATYAEWLWQEHAGVSTAQVAFDQQYGRGDEYWKIRIGDPGVEAMFHQAVYQRGAMAVHALRVAVGDDAFFRILRAWTAEHAYGNGSTAQFVALAERVSGKRLGDLFQTWLFSQTRPARPIAR